MRKVWRFSFSIILRIFPQPVLRTTRETKTRMVAAAAVVIGVVDVVVKVALVDIRGRVNKRREGGSDYFGTDYEGLKEDYLDAHIPGAVFVDWTKV